MNKLLLFHPKGRNTCSVPGTEPRTPALQADSLLCCRHANLPQPPHRTESTFYVFWRNHDFPSPEPRQGLTEAEPWLGASRPPVGLQQPLPRALQWGMFVFQECTAWEDNSQHLARITSSQVSCGPGSARGRRALDSREDGVALAASEPASRTSDWLQVDVGPNFWERFRRRRDAG